MQEKTDMYTTDTLKEKIVQTIEGVRVLRPLVPSLTNSVTIDLVANAQLAVGGSAAMIYLADEGEIMAANGAAFYMNFGTVAPFYEETVERTLKKLAELSRPWVLDPVAAGMGELRTRLLMLAKEYPPAIIRGNASEIITLAQLWGLSENNSARTVHGVDSTDEVMNAATEADALAEFIGGAVAVSGKNDLVTDGKQAALCFGGSPLFTAVTGAGCSLGGVAAVYAAVAEPFVAALTATQLYNSAGAMAVKKSSGPASFMNEVLDLFYTIEPQTVAEQSFTLTV